MRKLVLAALVLAGLGVTLALVLLRDVSSGASQAAIRPEAELGGDAAGERAADTRSIDVASARAEVREPAEVHAPVEGEPEIRVFVDGGQQLFPYDAPPDSFIEGEVVDEEEHPIVGAEVRARMRAVEFDRRPRFRDGDGIVLDDGGMHDVLRTVGAAVSDDSGRFRVALRGSKRVLLEIEAVHYHLFQDTDTGLPTSGRSAGSSDNEIVLRAAPPTRFTVVDATSARPIERFGLRLVREDAFSLDYSLKIEDHANGTLEMFVADGVSSCEIEAPDHAPQIVAIDATGSELHDIVIAMQPGGSIRGRVLFDGKPAESFRAECEGAVAEEPEVRVAGGSLRNWGRPHYSDLDSFFGHERELDGRDGALELGGLATGTYRLMLRSGGAEILLDAIAVVAGRATELGDVRIASNPRVRITALFPSGRVPPMYKIAAECAGKRGSRLVDSSGHCEFADIPGGSWKIEAPGEPFFLVGGLAHEFEIVPSVEREITIDLRGRTGAWLTITATLNGAPANGESLLARFGDAVDDARHTDARGRAMLWVPANVPIHASLHSNWGLPLGELVDGTTLLPGQEADTAVDLAVGELEIDLGELSGVDSETPATLSVETNAGAQIGRPIEIGGRYADRRDKSRVYALGPVAVGSYRLDLVATSTAIDGAEPANLHFARTVAIRAGELESVRFTDADLVK